MNRYGKILAVCLICLCICLPAMTVFSEQVRSQEAVIIDDGAGLLSAQEEQTLSLLAGEAAASMGWDIRIVTTDNAYGKDSQTYLEDYYMEHYHQDNGVAYLIDMDNRELYITTSGKAIQYLTDERINDLLDIAYEEVSSRSYARAFERMITRTVTYYRNGVPAGQYTYNTDTGEIQQYQAPPELTPMELLLSLGAGLLSFLGVVFGIRGSYRMKGREYRYVLADHAQTHVRNRDDRLINSFVTHRHIPRDTGGPGPGTGHSGGGHVSTTHVGSGGHTFGGGGRKF